VPEEAHKPIKCPSCGGSIFKISVNPSEIKHIKCINCGKEGDLKPEVKEKPPEAAEKSPPEILRKPVKCSSCNSIFWVKSGSPILTHAECPDCGELMDLTSKPEEPRKLVKCPACNSIFGLNAASLGLTQISCPGCGQIIDLTLKPRETIKSRAEPKESYQYYTSETHPGGTIAWGVFLLIIGGFGLVATPFIFGASIFSIDIGGGDSSLIGITLLIGIASIVSVIVGPILILVGLIGYAKKR
jgi:predicted RNA-binding Zn-ribbon protein involved in translation (DUF1610 family)